MLNVRSSACLQLYHRKIVCSLDPAPRPCLQASQNIYLFKFQIYLFKLLTVFVSIAEFHLSKSQTDCLLVRPGRAPRPCFRAVSQNIFVLNLKMYLFNLHNCICLNFKLHLSKSPEDCLQFKPSSTPQPCFEAASELL